MKIPMCDICGSLTKSDYIEVIEGGVKGIIMCNDCLHPEPEEKESFDQWWEQFEEYQKLKPRGRNGFDRVVQESRVQVDANLKILK